MFSEFSWNDNPERAFHEGVVEKQKPASAINPSLLAEAERLNAGKVINVADLDKPLF